jgi:peptide/nickel transport system permease protein
MSLAILPTITMLGTGIGRLISSAVFAEIVFARPGIGKLIYDSVISRNYPIVMGSVVVAAALFVLATTVSDIVNAMLDPRIRESL